MNIDDLYTRSASPTDLDGDGQTDSRDARALQVFPRKGGSRLMATDR